MFELQYATIRRCTKCSSAPVTAQGRSSLRLSRTRTIIVRYIFDDMGDDMHPGQMAEWLWRVTQALAYLI